MITLSEVKEYLHIDSDETSYDTFLTDLISEGYNIFSDTFDVTLNEDESITEIFYDISTDDEIVPTFGKKTIVSLKDEDDLDVTYKEKKTNLIVTSDNYEDETMTLVYNARINSELDKIIFIYVSYYFYKRADSRNDMFITSKNVDGVSESYMTIDDFTLFFQQQLLNLQVTRIL